MGILKYPQEFATDIPTVSFQAFTYEAPLPSLYLFPEPTLKAAPINMVTLYMPGDVAENISATWGPEEILQGAGGNWGSLAVSNLAGAASRNEASKKVVSSLGAGFGKAPLPTEMLMFKTVEPMSISLNFKMIPYNKEEGEIILAICRLFKQNIMPRIAPGTGSTLLQFPYVWDIWFSRVRGLGVEETTGNRNGYKMMALETCNVSFVSGTEGASVYENDVPTQINLTLGFKHIKKHWNG